MNPDEAERCATLVAAEAGAVSPRAAPRRIISPRPQPSPPDEFSSFRVSGGLRWQALAEWRSLLFGPQGLRLKEWLSAGRAIVVKHGPRRTVYRVDLPERAFFIKVYRAPTWLDVARRLVRSSTAKREFQRACEAARRGVPTVRCVAVGEQVRRALPGESWLVTEAIPESCSLAEFVEQRLPRLPAAARWLLRRKLAQSLARLCAAAHRAGVLHDDLHPGNVLVRLDTCSADRGDSRLPELHLIDLAGAKLSGPLNWRRSRWSLVMLAASWTAQASLRDAWRFWRAYLAERPELQSPGIRPGGREIAARIWARRRRIARSRDRRSLGDNREFYRLATPAAEGHAVADFPRIEFQRLLAAPDRPLAEGVHCPLKLAHRSVVVQAELPLAAGAVRVAYKRIRAKNWWKALVFFLCRSPALDAWYLGHALLLRGIATARPLVVCETTRFGLGRDSYLATQWIVGAINLHLYGWKLARAPADERRRRTRQAAAALGRLLGRMHAWHVSHRDLKGCNLLVVERREAVEAYLIDLDGVRLAGGLASVVRARNLGRLATSLEAHPWVTYGDRLRFLRAYLREAQLPADDWKPLWRASAAASRAITRRLARRGREVV